jgi:uncharacterized damage-inducible protein DinB
VAGGALAGEPRLVASPGARIHGGRHPYNRAMTTYLGRLVEYNNWANRGLLEFLFRQPPETLDATAGGVYGSIRETFEHLLTSELGYERRLAGLPRYDLEGRPERPDLEDLRRLADESAATLIALVGTLPDPEARLLTGSGHRAAATILTQVLTHAAEHRAHIGTILGSNGIEPPDLDSWAHGIWAHGDDWPEDWGPEPVDRASAAAG